MSKAFDYVPDFVLTPARPRLGVVVKTYNDPLSFHPRRRVFATLDDATEALRYLDPNADKVIAMYPTDAPVSGWVR